MGGDDSQKLLPWRGIHSSPGRKPPAQLRINNVTETAGWNLARGTPSFWPRPQLQTAWVTFGKQRRVNSAARRRIVVQDHSWLAGPGLKLMNVAAQEVLHRLIEEEFQIQRPRIGQRRHEAGQGALGATHHHVAEVCPIDLRLFPSKRMELKKRLAMVRTQPRHRTAQLHDAASIAAVANHLVEGRGA